MFGGTGLAVVVAAAVGMVNFGAHGASSLTGASGVEGDVVFAAASPATPLMTVGMNRETNACEGPGFQEKSVTLGKGDTFIEVLLRSGFSQRESYAASEALRLAYDPRDLRAGQILSLIIGDHNDSKDGFCLRRLEFVPETDRLVSIEHRAVKAFVARTSIILNTRKLMSRAGTVRSGLYEAAQAAGVPVPVLMQVYGTLRYKLDSQRNLRDDDTFRLVFEVFEDPIGQGQHPGDLKYAAIGLSGRNLRILRYTTADGYTGFFDDKGTSIETSLMKTPVERGRLSSQFGKRDHPVLGYTRMHRGLDFTAPRGTPVLAAGDGVVVRRDRNGSFGKFVEIRHDATYTTAYAHLSRYAEVFQLGARVRQGDVIGYVGATGLATGPNLHYEVLQKGEQVDPMKLELLPRRILRGKELARFEQAKAEFWAILARASPSKRSRRTAITRPTAISGTESY